MSEVRTKKMDHSGSKPTHVGIIMDGNGRWAQKQNQKRSFGHKAGVENVLNIVKHACEKKISYLTLYAFSNENWNRPEAEVSTLMTLLKTFLIQELPTFIENNVRLKTIGDTSKLPLFARQALEMVCNKTKDHKGLTLVLALSYGGRNEITRAIQKIGLDIKQGTLEPKNISDQTIEKYLDTQNMPDPDLIIRTSGEFRTSNFLPWQSTYSEYFVSPTLWPDFSAQEFDEALKDFSNRERRFGKVSA